MLKEWPRQLPTPQLPRRENRTVPLVWELRRWLWELSSAFFSSLLEHRPRFEAATTERPLTAGRLGGIMWTVDWDNGFVVGGDGNRRLTPGFRLKEFRRPDGTVRVHRELVSALQLLRDRFGRPLSVLRTEADGLGAVVAGEPAAALHEAAGRA